MKHSEKMSVTETLLGASVFGLLAFCFIAGMAPNLSMRLMSLGESIWPGYASELRVEPEPPSCSIESLQQKMTSCSPEQATADDPFAGADPFATPTKAPTDDPFAGADPFAAPTKAPTDDPFAGADPFAAPTKSGGSCPAVRKALERCGERHLLYEQSLERITPNTRRFRAIETRVADLARFAFWKYILVGLVLLAGFSSTARRMHISLREPTRVHSDRVVQAAQLVAHLFLAAACFNDFRVLSQSGDSFALFGLSLLWTVGFLALSALNVSHLLRPPAHLLSTRSWTEALLSIPLYVYMVLAVGLYFQGVLQHTTGQAIALHKFAQHPMIYLGIGLYIWAGMLLARTSIARRAFDVVKPLGLPPALLAWTVVVASALPTAYSGASGIFVIAAGAVIFEQLREAGASPRLAVIATAMSGSLGVVLRPCLVVVLISVLNKQVTTDALFHAGLYVFALTAVLFLIAMLWRNDQPIRSPDWSVATPKIAAALRGLIRPVLISLAIVALYGFGLSAWLDEQNAALILPLIMLSLLAWERPEEGLWRVTSSATVEAAHHIGALLFVMFGSVGLADFVERSDLMALFPSDFGSPTVAMAFLVVAMVLVGMTMDALGAVILVSVSLAKVAYDNGIDPIHFWMMVLVAFELGYLTPPVALNHLLARQVIGPDSHVELDLKDHWFEQHEHLLLPVLVMGAALIIVAFGPLAFYTS